MDFDDFVRLRGPALVRLARLLTGDRHHGEDLAQDVLARAFVHWGRITDAGSPDAYVRQMLVNASISRWRRRSSREIATETTHDEAAGGDLGAEVAERHALLNLVRDLPAKQRAAVVLRYYEDLDHAAIAELLRCSPITVRTQISRALATLRERMTAGPAASLRRTA